MYVNIEFGYIRRQANLVLITSATFFFFIQYFLDFFHNFGGGIVGLDNIVIGIKFYASFNIGFLA